MDEKLSRLSAADFAEKLASKEPTPGGGGGAALCGALGAALGAMAARLSERSAEDGLKSLIERLDAQRLRLLALADEDAAGFQPLAAAYAIPKGAPGRVEALQSATLTALEAPMEMLRRCAETAALLEELLPKCKKLLLSDVGCGAALVEGALRAASLNVYVNTRTLPLELRQPLERQAEGLVNGAAPRCAAIFAAVEARLRE